MFVEEKLVIGQGKYSEVILYSKNILSDTLFLRVNPESRNHQKGSVRIEVSKIMVITFGSITVK